MSLKGKVILLTGGTGSFGEKFTEIVLKEHDPKAVRIFSRGEHLQMLMAQRFNHDLRLRFFIGDVRDKERLHLAMNGVDIVVHAAALKQIPACEYNPFEAIQTNVMKFMRDRKSFLGPEVFTGKVSTMVEVSVRESIFELFHSLWNHSQTQVSWACCQTAPLRHLQALTYPREESVARKPMRAYRCSSPRPLVRPRMSSECRGPRPRTRLLCRPPACQ